MKISMQRNITKMSPEERQELLQFVNKAIEKDNRDFQCALRGGILLGYMEEIFGHRIDLFRRDSVDVWARAMVSYRLMREGFTTTEIGVQLMKDHSTVSHLNKKMKEALDHPHYYNDILPFWQEFLNKIENDIHERPIGDPVSV